MKILFTNCWQSENTGDNAIWKNMMLRLKEAFPDATFTICSQKTEPWDMKQLSEISEVKVIPLTLVPGLSREDLEKLETDESIETYLQNKAELAVDDLKEADVVISQGGGYMSGDGMWEYLAYFYIAQHLGKPTFFGSQTFVGKLGSPTKRLARIVFDRAKLVAPREIASYRFITDYVGAAGGHIKVLPDAVFDIAAEQYKNKLPENAIKIGIRGYAAPLRFLSAVATFADMVVETIGPVVFVPIGHGGDRNDITGAQQIAKMMDHESLVIEEKLTAGELIDVLNDGILVSDRYHGIVYAAHAHTPFVPMTPDIEYKMSGLLQRISYPYNTVLDTKTVNANEILGYAVDVWKDRESIKQRLEKVVPIIKVEAGLAYKYIIEGIKNEIT